MKLTTAEVARRLGVKPATVYAYASRGLLRPERAADGRTSLFEAREVDALAARGRRGQAGPRLAVSSAITEIDGTTYRYRGIEATSLAGRRSFEEVAEWLWDGAFPEPPCEWPVDARMTAVAARAQRSLPERALPIDRIRVIVAAAAVADDLRFEVSPASARAAGRVLLGAMVDALPLAAPGALRTATRLPRPRLAARLWPRLTTRPAAPDLVGVLEAAMVLCADHELAASTLAVRVAASVQADPYSAVSAGLGALAGARHGAASLAAEDLLAEAEADGAAAAVGRRLRRGERVGGFGQPLYPRGDPRAPVLLALAERVAGGERRGRARLATARQVVALMEQRGLPRANVDFGLAALVRAAGMVRGAGEAVVAVARSAGWLAHALEEYAAPTRFRIRATRRPPDAAP